MSLHSLYYDIELPLIEVLANMESRGIAIDVPHFYDIKVDADVEAAESLWRIHEMAGREVNPRSSPQLVQLLYKELKQPVFVRTKKKVPSTNKAALNMMEHPIAALILEYRETATALSNFIDKLPLLAIDGRLHASFNQAGHHDTDDDEEESPATGRLSSSGPNLQQISARGKWGTKIRQGFVADPGFILMSGDVDQEEYRLACLAADEQAVLPFFADPLFDPHQQTADELAKLGVVVTRQDAKNINYALIYGAMSKKLLAMAPGLGTEAVAATVIEAFFKARPRLKEWHLRVIADTKQKGYAESYFGRRRYLPDIASSQFWLRTRAERQAINHVIQGTGADIIKIALARVAKGLLPGGYIVLTSHDDIVVQVPVE